MIGDIRPVRERPSPLSVILLCLLVWICAMFQVGFLHRLPLFGAPMELTLAVVCMIGWRRGALTGAIVGTVGGYVLDSLAGTGVSLCPLLFLAAGVLMGLLAERLFDRPITYLLSLFPVCISFFLYRAIASEAVGFGGKVLYALAVLFGAVLAGIIIELPVAVRYYKRRK